MVFFNVQISNFSVLLLLDKLRLPLSHGPQAVQLLREHWENLPYQCNMMLLLTLPHAGNPELHLLFFQGSLFAFFLWLMLQKQHKAPSDTKWEYRILGKLFFHAFHRLYLFLKVSWDFASFWLEICIYLMSFWFDLGLLCLTNGVIFGDSLIKGYLCFKA